MYFNGICFITEKKYCDMSVYDAVREVLKAGVTFIQYREKDEARREIYEEALRLRELTRSFNAVLIINDHADIALAADADGVHLGQDDLPLQDARKVMGNRIIGISTHTREQAREAEAEGADYIGFGPMFHTTTKDAGMPVGTESLRSIRKSVGIPVVAIGGINFDNLEDVISAGADAVAIATAIVKGDISRNAAAFVRVLKKIQDLRSYGI